MADVFLSYKKDDRAIAEAAVAALERAGYSVWWDERLTPLEHWDRLIEQEIEAAKAVLVLWTARSVESDWVRIEANYGAEHAKLIQVRVGGCKTPLAYSMLQRADLDENSDFSGSAWRKALDWIALLTGRGAETAATDKNAAGESAVKNFFGGENISDIFDDLFGFKGDHGAASGDLFVPVVLTIAEAVHGKAMRIEPVAGAAKPETLSLEIPPGLAPGDKVRLAGKGRERAGGGVGDLYLVIAVRDDSGFTAEGRDLIGELRVTPGEIRDGGERDLALPTGGAIRVRIPAGVTESNILRAVGKGLPGRGHIEAGDLMLKIRIG
jgi:curved DNA-binding protein CbpA